MSVNPAAVMRREGEAIWEVAKRLDGTNELEEALELLASARLVVVSGTGKSGDIARKIAGTMTSTGTRAIFLDPTRAMHGDLGLIDDETVVVCLSRSGECLETVVYAGHIQNTSRAKGLVALTTPGSALARHATIVLDCSLDYEADVEGLVPTCSTAAALALGDGIAMALRARRGHTANDFRTTHPLGALPG